MAEIQLVSYFMCVSACNATGCAVKCHYYKLVDRCGRGVQRGARQGPCSPGVAQLVRGSARLSARVFTAANPRL